MTGNRLRWVFLIIGISLAGLVLHEAGHLRPATYFGLSFPAMGLAVISKRIFLAALALATVTACSRVTVRQTGTHTYFLKCYYSNSKCDAAIRKVCRDEDKVSNVISRSQKMESSYLYLLFGFMSTGRPVDYVTVECVEWKPKARDSTTTSGTNIPLPPMRQN